MWATWCGASRRRRAEVPAHFNLIDALLALVVVLGMVAGWRRGFLLGALGLGVLAASLLLAFRSYQYPARELENHALLGSEWALPAAFLGTFIIVRVLLGAIAMRIVAALPARAHRHRANRTLGLVPGLADGTLHAMIVAVLLLALPLPAAFAALTRESPIATQLAIPAEWLEAKLTPIFQAAVSKTLNRMVIKPGSRESVPLGFATSEPKTRADLEAHMLQLLNEERKAKGLGVLRADPELTQLARQHSRDMLARGYFSHLTPEGRDPVDRMRAAQVRYRTAGENLAFAPTLAIAHQALMNSPGHRANILRPAFGRVGIGILEAGGRGEMVTQEFRD
jgi:uncharacterized protein YkwD